MLSPEEMQTLEGTVRQLMAERKFSVMAELIEHYRKDEPDNPVLAIWLVDVYLLGKRRDDAEKVLSDIKDRHPDHPLAYWGLARIAIKLGDHEKVEAMLADAEQKLAAYPGAVSTRWFTDSYLGLARIYNERGEHSRARDVCRRHLSLNPGFFNAYRFIFSSWLADGRLDKAGDAAREAMRTVRDAGERLEAAVCERLCRWAEGALPEIVARARTAAWPAAGRPGIVLAQVVWGEKYINTFIYHLRSLLAPGNLPEMARDMDVLMVLVTTEQDLASLRERGILDAFEGIMKFEFVIIPPDIHTTGDRSLPGETPYYLYAIGQHFGIAFARQAKAGVCLLTADLINADGLFGHVARLAKEGRKGVVGTGMICNRDAFMKKLEGPGEERTAPLILSPRKLTELAVGNLHEFIERAIVSPDNGDFDNPPAVLYWRSDEGLIGHGFNLHPVYVAPEVLAAYETHCYERVDGMLLQKLFGDRALWEDLAVMTDSDTFCLVTLADEDKYPCSTGYPFDIELERNYVRDRHLVHDLNIWLFRHKLIFRWPEEQRRKNEYDPLTVENILAAR